MARTQKVNRPGCRVSPEDSTAAHLFQVHLSLHHLLDGVFRKGRVAPQEAGQALLVPQEVFEMEA